MMLKFLLIVELGNNWRAGISWNYNSGMPYTQIYGYYNKLQSFRNINFAHLYLQDYGYFPILADRNAAHLPDYHRLDINLSKKFRIGFMNLSIDLNVINVYDRKNFFYFDTENR